ncbi:unnamed protein product [marine sediment metagenome]|uniref:Uncharacterized protein n=1 Tax=marine sediment metagenome TaxID=412755 RepID=X0Y0J8_9ZZZZ
MKKFILIICIFISINTNAQYNNSKGWKSPELYLPASILVSTFIVNDYRMNNNIGSQKQTAQIALTGFATSLAVHFIFKKIRKSKKRNY